MALSLLSRPVLCLFHCHFSTCYIVKVSFFIFTWKFSLSCPRVPASVPGLYLFHCCYFSFCPSWYEKENGQNVKEREQTRDCGVRTMTVKNRCVQRMKHLKKSHLSLGPASSLCFSRDNRDKSWIRVHHDIVIQGDLEAELRHRHTWSFLHRKEQGSVSDLSEDQHIGHQRLEHHPCRLCSTQGTAISSLMGPRQKISDVNQT